MYTTNSRRSRYSARAAAIATTAIIFGVAACGTETGSDNVEPASSGRPRPAGQGHPALADVRGRGAERRAYAEQQEQYRRHLEAGAAAQDLKSGAHPPTRARSPPP